MEIQLPPFCKKNLSLSFIWTFLIAPENYYNLSLIFEKIGFPFSSDQNIKFVADYKLRQAKKNITYFEDIILFWIPFSNLIYFSREIRTLGWVLNIDNQTDVIS